MKIYSVGGAVRDALLGLPVKDHDYVVVGATPEQMVRAGYRPVGKDFPVFLHPHTQDEYALARTERKTAPGYRGFVVHAAPEVTLEEDLARRDLTINAIAKAEDGTLCDPYGGQRDLAQRVFRHVSDAFTEDPVRILRLARFAARLSDFSVAPETEDLMRAMVAAGEVDALVAERVWQELARGLMEQSPSRMFAVLRDCGALARVMPEFDALYDLRAMQVLDFVAARDAALEVRFAALALALDADVGQIGALCKRLKVPNECRDLAVMAARERANIDGALELRAEAAVSLLERCDGFRKPERFGQMLQTAESVQRGVAYPQSAHLATALAAARAVNAGEIAQRTADTPARIPEAIHAVRVTAVEAAWKIA